MEFLVIASIIIIILIVLKVVLEIKLKKIKEMGEKKDLDEIAKKYPGNIEICQEYLKKVKNETVNIEENKEATTTMYIAITNKILIANLKNSYTRIQTLAHECLHSIQDRKILLFNFWFSNFYLLYFILITGLALLKKLPYEATFLTIFVLLGFVYYMVRSYLENDAMIKARFLAKEYMEEKKISTTEEIKEMIKMYDELNHIGIKCVNYNLFFNVMIKIILFIFAYLLGQNIG